jgi:hypothetical protein
MINGTIYRVRNCDKELRSCFGVGQDLRPTYPIYDSRYEFGPRYFCQDSNGELIQKPCSWISFKWESSSQSGSQEQRHHK